MKAASLDSSENIGTELRPGLLDRLARRIVLDQLRGLQHGMLVIRDGNRQHVYGQTSAAGSLSATITIRDPRFYSEVAFGGSIGSGVAWMERYWDCDDLVQLVRLIVRNRDLLDGMETGLGRVTRMLQRFAHRINRNTRRTARKNIAAHYDLGNEFFALWLDESMMYSSAIFANENATLAEAQQTRLHRVCQSLELQPDDHLLEIGTGWGAMAIHAARHYGCRVTTTTISQKQHEIARQRIEEAGLQERITLLLDDYRDLTGQYDKLVSLEMIEAIGHTQFDNYFAKCSSLLRPGGRMLIQAITIEDDRYEQYRKNVDFIQKFVFPGGCLPSERVMRESIDRVTNMTVRHVEDIGLHYATTLNHWRHNFFAKLDQVRALGYPDRFIRMWEYYLCYSEGGFLERSISDVLLVADQAAA